MMTQLLTVEETAALLRLAPRTVRKLTADGELPAVDLGHSSVRYRAEDVEAFIQRKLRSTSRTAAEEAGQ